MSKKQTVAETYETCHICQPHKLLKHDGIVAHIKHVHGIADCNRKNLEEYNKSDDGFPKEETEGMDLFKDELMAEESSTDEPIQFTAADVEGPVIWDFSKDDGHTLDAYLADTGANQTIKYHFDWLTACIGVATNSAVFIAKQRIDGRTQWNEIPKRGLQELLGTKSALIMHNGRNKDWLYSKLLDVPVINNAFKRYDCIDFASCSPYSFDIWQGYAFPIMPKAEPIRMDLLELWFQHLLEIICNGNTKHYLTLLMKDAWMYQNPNDHLQFATVLMGEEGVGKNRYTDVLCDLWGEHWSQRNITSMDQITSDTQRDVISNKKLIVPNELASLEQGRTKNFDTLKSRITDSSYNVRNIYERTVKVRNVNNYVFATNNWDSIKMGARDRRYFVLDVSDAVLQNTAYFDRLCSSFTDEMKMHLLNFYLRFDTTGFNPFIPIMTDLKEEIQESQLHPAEQWAQQWEGMTPAYEPASLTLDEMWKEFVSWADSMGLDRTALGKPGAWFGRRISRYLHVVKSAKDGGKHMYSKKKSEEFATISDEERKAYVEEQLARKKVDEEIKKRLG
jgi:hypothetical protein